MDNETVDRTFAPAARAALAAFPIDAQDLDAGVAVRERHVQGDRRTRWPALTSSPAPAGLSHARGAGLRARLDPGPGRGRHRRPRCRADARRPGLCPGDDPGHRRAAIRRHGALDRRPPALRGAGGNRPTRSASRSSFTQLGAITAAMHNQASAWRPPPGFKRHALDSDGLMGMAPHWGPFWEHRSLSAGERSLLLDVRQRMHDMLSAVEPGAIRLQHDPRRHASGQHRGRRRPADRHRLRRRGLWLAPVRHRHRRSRIGRPSRMPPRSSAPSSPAIAPTARSPTKRLSLIPQFRLIRWMATIGWFHQRPELNRPSAVFEERKAWVLEQCAALQRS